MRAGNPRDPPTVILAAGDRRAAALRDAGSAVIEITARGMRELRRWRERRTREPGRIWTPFGSPEVLETFAVEQPDVQLDFLEGPSDELAAALLHAEIHR